jgi:hypothetical protein
MRLFSITVAMVAWSVAASCQAAEDPAAASRRLLVQEFDAFLAAPADFELAVRRQCSVFPEGDLFPYILPALAYTNLALEDPAYAPTARGRIAQLIELARPGVEKRAGKLDALKGYGRQGVYLGQFNLALACYRRVGGDGRYDAAHKTISDALHDALVHQEGLPLSSYPSLSWTFDTIPCLVSLRLYDLRTGTHRSDEAIAQHLKWVEDHATDRATGLPSSRIAEKTGQPMAEPRGCELSWRIALLADLDAGLAKRMYGSYVKSFWLERGPVEGFAEWPFGKSDKQDADSGPIIMGVGSAATAFGIAAAKAADDPTRHLRLCRQVAGHKAMMKVLIAQNPKDKAKYTCGGRIDPDSSYCTGFLFGDACLFYALSWHPLCPAQAGDPTSRSAEVP